MFLIRRALGSPGPDRYSSMHLLGPLGESTDAHSVLQKSAFPLLAVQ